MLHVLNASAVLVFDADDSNVSEQCKWHTVIKLKTRQITELIFFKFVDQMLTKVNFRHSK